MFVPHFSLSSLINCYHYCYHGVAEMGTIVPRGEGFRAVVRKLGITKTKTFTRKALADKWIKETEYAIEHRQIKGGNDLLGSVLRRYRTEIIEKRPFQGKTHFHLRRFEEDFKGQVLAECDHEWWIDQIRTWKVSPGSRMRYLSLIAGALSAAQELWDIQVDWDAYRKAKSIAARLHLIGKGKQRDRRSSDDEHRLIIDHVGSSLPFEDIFYFALDSGMRESEICRLRWRDYDKKDKMIWVRDRKHNKKKIGNDWNVPLLGRCAKIIERQPCNPEDDRIFPYEPGTIGAAWRRARVMAVKKNPSVSDIHWHDVRHEALSRLFELGYQIQEVALVSGHRDWSSLKIYTNLKPKSLHHGPVSKRNIDPSLLAQVIG